MAISIRSKLTFWYITSISLLIIAFFIFTYYTFSHAIYDSDVIKRFDHELLNISRDIKKKVAKLHGPFFIPIGEYEIILMR